MKEDLFNNFFPNNIFTAMSGAPDGSMGLSSDQDEEKLVNRRKFLEQAGIAPDRFTIPRMTHSATVLPVASPIKVIADGLVTEEINLFLAITVADCLPIFIFDPEHEAIGMIHAGWRGIVAGIVPNALVVLAEQFGSDSAKHLVGIGPSIGPCHYWAKSGVVEQFADFKKGISIEHNGKKFIDLRAAVVQQLEEGGVSRDNIKVINECTYDYPDKYFSWRRDQPGELRTMMAVFGKRSSSG